MITITLIALILAIPLSSIGGSIPNSKGSYPINTASISTTLYIRIVAIALLFAALISFLGGVYSGYFFEISGVPHTIDGGYGLYSGLIHTTTITQTIEVFLLISGALILLTPPSFIPPFSKGEAKGEGDYARATEYGPKGVSHVGSHFPPQMMGKAFFPFGNVPEYPIIILFTTAGATFLLASADLVSIYLSIELQSFGVYILAALYRDSESATAAGLKYFLLGALSSALILLGCAGVYAYTGTTALDSIYELISVVPQTSIGLGPRPDLIYGAGGEIVILSFIFITVGLLFKVASAPFHYWAPDVYDGTPTIVTTWLTVIPKISIFIFLLGLCGVPAVMGAGGVGEGVSHSYITSLSINHLLLICAFLSLVIGTIVGLGQYRIKRLLAYSTISHVGFLLAALSVSSGANVVAGSDAVSAFLFYIVQYTITNIDTFLILLAFGYYTTSPTSVASSNSAFDPSLSKTKWVGWGGEGEKGGDSSFSDISLISSLQGRAKAYPVLGLSIAICLFSMAGVPPLIGFFAKYTLLYSCIHNGYMFLSIVAILASVVSAVYYLRIIRVLHFSFPSFSTPSHSTNSLPPSSFGSKEAKQHKGKSEAMISAAPSLIPNGEKKNSLIPLSLYGGPTDGGLNTEEKQMEAPDFYNGSVTSVHSYVIASMTSFILLFAVAPNTILTSTSIMALSIYYT